MRESMDLLNALAGSSPFFMTPHHTQLTPPFTAANLASSRIVYISHGLSAWNALLFSTLLQQDQLLALIFIDPLDPRDALLQNNDAERNRLAFGSWATLAMHGNAFGVIQPFFRSWSYFAPVWNLPSTDVPFYVDAISRQSFWATLVDESDALHLSARETLARFPHATYVLGELPVAAWTRKDSSSMMYFSTLS